MATVANAGDWTSLNWMERLSPVAATTTARHKVQRWSWLFAVPPLTVWAIALVQFALLSAADQRLYRAAAAAAQEAILPRASHTSVVLAAQRALEREHCAESSPDIELQINAHPATSHWIDCRTGDTVSVTLTTDPRFFVPDLLRAIGLSIARSPLCVTALLQKP
jgi:hypothetical protein